MADDAEQPDSSVSWLRSKGALTQTSISRWTRIGARCTKSIRALVDQVVAADEVPEACRSCTLRCESIIDVG